MPRIRTGYSFRAAVGKIEDVMDRLIECGYKHAPITDRASTFGFVPWAKLAKEKGLKPVFGIELAVTPSLKDKRPQVDYWTFIAKDDIRYINELFELATTQYKYPYALLTYDQAQAAQGVFKIVGYKSNLDLITPAEDLYVGLGPSTAKGYLRKALEKNIGPIALNDNKYPYPDDRTLYEVICGRDADTQSYSQFIQSDDDWLKENQHKHSDEDAFNEALGHRNFVLENSNAKLKKGVLLTPEKPKTLFQMCIEGATKLNINLEDPVYRARLDRELNLITEKNFEDYFYIITDFVQMARKIMLVGPGRGSSCGSLVCYLLEITAIDPIPTGLLFERFIDINRNDLPDIDIDLSDSKRHLAFEYMEDKYGADHVAKLGSVSMYKAGSAINEAGKALKIPKWRCDAVKESMLKTFSEDERATDSIEDTFKTILAGQELIRDFPEMAIATKMEGHPRHSSTHAAGIILTQDPVKNYVAIDRRTGSIQCNKVDAEDLNLLKIDSLALIELSVLEDALEIAGLDRLALEKIPQDDPEAFKILNDGKFSGVFQFEGPALQSVMKSFETKNLEDIVDVIALGRPGPLSGGGTNNWVRRKNKLDPVTYPHPMFEPYLKDTLGIVIYQEQVMEISKHIGGLSWPDVSALRKAMSRTYGKEAMDKFGDKWKKGAIEKGGDPETMNRVWDDLCSHGAYSFNKSHARAYGTISYWCCWMKAHYPFEYAAASLSHRENPETQIKLLREMDKEGYSYIPVDPEKSIDKWTFGQRDGKRILIGPVSNVKGIGPKTIQAIMSAKARDEELPPKAAKLLANPVTPIDSLWPIRDAFRRILPDPATRNITTPATNVVDVQIQAQDYHALIFCVFSQINPRDENEAVKIARRKGLIIVNEPTAFLNLRMTDDTDTIFGQINRWDYMRIGKAVVDRGKPSKCLYAVKGLVRKAQEGRTPFRMINIKSLRYIGDITDPAPVELPAPKLEETTLTST